MPGPVGLGDIGERVLADPPVAGERVAGEQVEGGSLAGRLGRALRRHLRQIDGGDADMADVEGGRREHDRPVARERGQDADEGLGHRLAAGAMGGIADQSLDGGLAHGAQQVAQYRHGIELRPRRGIMGACREQQVDDLPPQRGLRRIDPGGSQCRIDHGVAAFRIGMRLGAGDLVRPQDVDRRDRGSDQFAHAVGNAFGAGGSHHQAQQIDQESALGR